jgi:hypothetical protein
LTLQLNGKALLRFVLQRQTYIHKMKVWIIKNKNNISFRIRDKQLNASKLLEHHQAFLLSFYPFL